MFGVDDSENIDVATGSLGNWAAGIGARNVENETFFGYIDSRRVVGFCDEDFKFVNDTTSFEKIRVAFFEKFEIAVAENDGTDFEIVKAG